MATDAKEPPQTSSDVRLMERNLRKGAITQKDVEKHIKSLPDSKDKVAVDSEDKGSER